MKIERVANQLKIKTEKSKMKNFKKIALLILIMVSMFNCSHDTQIGNEDDKFENSQMLRVTSLASDQDFILYLNNTNMHLEGIKDIVKAEELLEKGENISEQEKEELAIAFGYNSYISWATYHVDQSRLLKKLDDKYALTEMPILDLEDNIADALGYTNQGSFCEDRYSNCLAGAMAQAIIAHVGCGWADLTVAAGILCHGAVYAWHTSMNNDCGYAYHDCLG